MKIANHSVLLLFISASSMTNSVAIAEQIGGPILWQDVRSGMSETELKKLHPTIQLSERGALVQYNVDVAGMTFDAYFNMNAGRVQAVQLQGKSANAQTLIDGLSAKYGAASAPYKCDAPASPARKCTAVWSVSGNVAVTLSAYYTPGFSLTALRYEAASSNGL